MPQNETLTKMRTSNPNDPKGPFLYSTPVNMPKVANTAYFFDM